MTLDKNSKIYVAGHNSLVGSAFLNNLLQRGYTNLVGRSYKEMDMTDQVTVKHFFDEEQLDGTIRKLIGVTMFQSLSRTHKLELTEGQKLFA